MQFLIRFFLKLFFRLRTKNLEILKGKGPFILTPNHVSWLDALFLYALLDSSWKFAVSQEPLNLWCFSWLQNNPRLYVVDPTNPFALRHMRNFLQEGGKLVLFPEGSLSHTGKIRKFFDGIGFLIRWTHTPIITCHLCGLERSIFARQKGWKKWIVSVQVVFLGPHTPPQAPHHVDIMQLRSWYTEWLRDLMIEERFLIEYENHEQNILQAIRTTSQAIPQKIVLEDALGKKLNYKTIFIGSSILKDLLEKENLSLHVCILLPNSCGQVLTCMALWMMKKTPALLNFSSGIKNMKYCSQLVKSTHIITSRAFIEKGRLNIDELKNNFKIIYLDDILPQVHFFHKLKKTLSWKKESHGENSLQKKDTAAILFTSGSEGKPKAVCLSHGNILANCKQLYTSTDLTDTDKVLNALPMFHSFGFSIGSIFPLMFGLYAYQYVSPLHYRIIPYLCYDKNITILISTNTFLNGYAKRAHNYDFHTIKRVFAGAEKVQPATAELWAKRFDVRLLEGYGTTECAPVVSMNHPLCYEFGTVGKPLPGMKIKIVPQEGIEEGGALWLTGPNLMKGYLQEDGSLQGLEENWYHTGDIASLTPGGYLKLHGRLKRFAKISGEMVSLEAIESHILHLGKELSSRFEIACLNIPDENKGEIIIAFVNDSRINTTTIREYFLKIGLTILYTPKEVIPLKIIPRLGSGKINYPLLKSSYQDGTLEEISSKV